MPVMLCRYKAIAIPTILFVFLYWTDIDFPYIYLLFLEDICTNLLQSWLMVTFNSSTHVQ